MHGRRRGGMITTTNLSVKADQAQWPGSTVAGFAIQPCTGAAHAARSGFEAATNASPTVRAVEECIGATDQETSAVRAVSSLPARTQPLISNVMPKTDSWLPHVHLDQREVHPDVNTSPSVTSRSASVS